MCETLTIRLNPHMASQTLGDRYLSQVFDSHVILYTLYLHKIRLSALIEHNTVLHQPNLIGVRQYVTFPDHHVPHFSQSPVNNNDRSF